MHYCCFVFTKEFPTDKVLQEVLEPYNWEHFYSDDENRVYPMFTWDWFVVGGRYSGKLKLEIRKHDEKYRWEFYERNPRNNRLFRSKLIDVINGYAKASADGRRFDEENVWNELGFSDGYIRVDACPLADISNINELSCCCFVDKNGNAYSKERWNGNSFEEHKDFEEELRKTISESADCYLCVVDLHD